MIEVVFFDAMGTLIYLPQSVGHHYRIVAERHGLLLSEEELNTAFRTVWKQMPARPVTKKPRPDDDKEWWRELVMRVFEIFSPGQMIPDFEACFEEIYSHFTERGVWELYPEALNILSRSGEKYRLGIISNFDGRLRLILDQLGILARFEKVIISSETGADKPSPYIFQHALDSMNVTAANALHVGDDPINDWQAGADAGMNVYKLERPRTTLAGLEEYIDALTSRAPA